MDPTASHPIAEKDMAFLIGVFARLGGSLRGGALDAGFVEDLASSCVRAGLLDLDVDDALPTAGRVAVALSNLIERLRYAMGEYDEHPTPIPEGTEHHLVFPTSDSAQRCAEELCDAVAVRTVSNPQDRWMVGAVYPEIAPDPGFQDREHTLTVIAHRLGGRYAGSGDVPTRTQPRAP